MAWLSLSAVRYALLCTYFAALFLLAVYALHRWYLLFLYLRHRRSGFEPHHHFERPPRLTVQLPLYNEMYVAHRLIRAVCALDYPQELLEIQVLDDSTDETADLVREEVVLRQAEGFHIEQIRRRGRRGFKAGALQEGLARARGELVAIFDADFVPPRGFARRLVHHFTDPDVGMVQARWDHLNRDHSALTRVQSMLLDGHFIVEHTVRNRSGRFFNFNGTAGIWRRSCIEDAGGWSHDTLTEDLDLSYRAQLRGWKFVYLPEEVCPGELPVEMTSFKSQQHRWAKGSVQTARKLLPRILRSRLPLSVKIEAVFHLAANFGYLLVLVVAMLVGPAVWLRQGVSVSWLLALDLPLFVLSTLSVAAFFFVAEREAVGSWRQAARSLPLLMAIGIGLSINNARAVLEVLFGRESEFRRTPKYNLGPGERITSRRYRGRPSRDTWIEGALALYFTGIAVAAALHGLWGALPFVVLFQAGFAYTAWTTLLETRRGSAGIG